MARRGWVSSACAWALALPWPRESRMGSATALRMAARSAWAKAPGWARRVLREPTLRLGLAAWALARKPGQAQGRPQAPRGREGETRPRTRNVGVVGVVPWYAPWYVCAICDANCRRWAIVGGSAGSVKRAPHVGPTLKHRAEGAKPCGLGRIRVHSRGFAVARRPTLKHRAEWAKPCGLGVGAAHASPLRGASRRGRRPSP